LALSNIFFNRLNYTFSHSLSYSHYPQRDRSQGDIINEVEYSYNSLSLFSNLKYAIEEGELRSLITSLIYNKPNYDIMLTHFYNNDLLFNNKKTNFMQSRLDYRVSSKDSYIAQFDYNLEHGYNHEWSLGWSHKQRCWSGKISIGQEIVPNRDNSFKNTSYILEFKSNIPNLGGY